MGVFLLENLVSRGVPLRGSGGDGGSGNSGGDGGEEGLIFFSCLVALLFNHL